MHKQHFFKNNKDLVIGVLFFASLALVIASHRVDYSSFPKPVREALAAVAQITGEGEINKVAAFNGANTIGNSQIYDNGTNVGIGTTAPEKRLDIQGSMRASGRIGTQGYDPDSGYPNGWGGGIHTWDVYARGSVRADGALCLGGDCRNAWPAGGRASCRVCIKFCDKGPNEIGCGAVQCSAYSNGDDQQWSPLAGDDNWFDPDSARIAIQCR